MQLREQKQREIEAFEDGRVDEILVQVHEAGLDSLTAEERAVTAGRASVPATGTGTAMSPGGFICERLAAADWHSTCDYGLSFALNEESRRCLTNEGRESNRIQRVTSCL